MRWLDTHNHVCDLAADGAPRPDFQKHLLAVLAADPNDLQLVISPDGLRMGRIGQEADAMLAGAEMIHRLVQASDGRLHGACMVNPKFLRTAHLTMDRCFGEWGFRLLGEMMQYSMGFRLASPACLELLRHAAQLGVPVMVHIATFDVSQGELTGTGQLADLMQAAEAVPEGRYILGHFVGMPEDNPPHVTHYLDAIESRYGTWPTNFWAEIRDFSSPGLAEALARIPHDRLVSGTDWCTRGDPPFAPFGTAFDAILNHVDNPCETPPSSQFLADCLRQEGATEEEVQQIAHGNAARLLALAPESESASATPKACGPLPEDWSPEQSSWLYLTSIPATVSADELASALGSFGPVRRVQLGRDTRTGRPWGHAFVQMASPEAARVLQANLRQLDAFGTTHAGLVLAPRPEAE